MSILQISGKVVTMETIPYQNECIDKLMMNSSKIYKQAIRFKSLKKDNQVLWYEESTSYCFCRVVHSPLLQLGLLKRQADVILMSEGFLSETHSWTFRLVKKSQRGKDNSFLTHTHFYSCYTFKNEVSPESSCLSIQSVFSIEHICIQISDLQRKENIPRSSPQDLSWRSDRALFNWPEQCKSQKTLTAGKCLQSPCKNPPVIQDFLFNLPQCGYANYRQAFPSLHLQTPHSFSKATGRKVSSLKSLKRSDSSKYEPCINYLSFMRCLKDGSLSLTFQIGLGNVTVPVSKE